MPHVVTVSPRRHAFVRRSTAAAIRARVDTALAQHYRPEHHAATDSVRLYFSPRANPREAKNEVAAILDAADPRWKRAFALYPNEQSLRKRGY